MVINNDNESKQKNNNIHDNSINKFDNIFIDGKRNDCDETNWKNTAIENSVVTFDSQTFNRTCNNGEKSVETNVALNDLGQLKLENLELQNIIFQLFSDEIPKGVQDDINCAFDYKMENRYICKLNEIEEIQKEMNKHKIESEKMIKVFETQLRKKEQYAVEISKTLGYFKQQIAENARDNRTGKVLTKKRIEELNKKENEIDEILEKERLRYVTFHSHVKKLQNRLREKEQLSEDNSLIDFEQLQLENKKLFEKIEDYTNEISLLKNKLSTSKKLILNGNEKQTAIVAKNKEIELSLEKIELPLYNDRNKLFHLKRRFIHRANESKDCKKKDCITNNELFVMDFEKTNKKLEIMGRHLSNLKQRHHEFIRIQI